MPTVSRAVLLRPTKHNQMLPPAWRWERAGWLREGKKRARPSVREDQWVSLSVRFQNALFACQDDVDHERLADRFPGLYKAWEFFQERDQLTRHTIEAYLCADAATADIATRTGEHPETVGCYAKIFFDVRGKQRHWLYMLNKVMGPSVHNGLSERQYDLLYKLYGLLYGPLFLDQIIRHSREPSRMLTYSEGQSVVRDSINTSLETKTLYAARTIPVAYNQEVIFSMYAKLVEIEKETGGSASGQSLILTNINKMMINFGFAPSVDIPVNSHLADGVELRASEMIERALGGAPALTNCDLGTFPTAGHQEPADAKQGS